MKWRDEATPDDLAKIERLTNIIIASRAEMRRIKARLTKRAQRKEAK